MHGYRKIKSVFVHAYRRFKTCPPRAVANAITGSLVVAGMQSRRRVSSCPAASTALPTESGMLWSVKNGIGASAIYAACRPPNLNAPTTSSSVRSGYSSNICGTL